ncbi:MAG: VWA domain-containing protein [Gaiella sp.]
MPEIAPVELDPVSVLLSSARDDRLERGAIGSRERSLVALRRGKYSRHRLARAGDVDLALDATVRAAASRAGRRGSARVQIAHEDLRRKVREHRVPFEVCFVVDNSYSLHADRLVERVKGVVFRLLEDAAARGDRISLVAFRPGVAEATVALRPTASAAVAARRLREIPLSGRTPLPDALRRARRLVRQELAKRPNARPVVVIVSDGLPNVALAPRRDALEDTLAEARALRRAKVGVVVVDAAVPGRPGADVSCAAALATAGGGSYLPLAGLTADTLLGAVEAIA